MHTYSIMNSDTKFKISFLFLFIYFIKCSNTFKVFYDAMPENVCKYEIHTLHTRMQYGIEKITVESTLQINRTSILPCIKEQNKYFD